MTINFDTNTLADDVPVVDAIEQHQPADASVEAVGPDTEQVADLPRDANPSAAIDQAIIVPSPDDDIT
jgi:hypothetical protein